MAIYDRLGHDYDVTRRADPAILGRLLHHLGGSDAGTCLDVACGTGNYTVALAEAGLRMYGLDHSWRMIDSARLKQTRVAWLLGDVRRLPFCDGSFSRAVCTLAIHHFPSLSAAFREICRVVRPGRFVLFTATAEQMRGYWLNAYFPEAMERSIRQMPGLDQILGELGSVGFGSIRIEPYEVAPDLQDLFLYSGKHRPELYLDPRIRAGISTFSSLAGDAEVRVGCERLARDVESGRIAEVIGAYRQQAGDYVFVIAES